MEEQTKTPMESVNFTARTYQALSFLPIPFLEDLQNYTAVEILRYQGVGKTTIREIRKVMAYYGLKLKGDYVCDTESEKRLIQDMPNQIKVIMADLHKLERHVGFLCKKLDELHFNMLPRD
jgi:hypothetical protein